MQLCSKYHEEVCYDSLNCPACELVDKINELEKDLKKEEKKRESAEDELDSALSNIT